MSISEKIPARASGVESVTPGDLVGVKVDTVVLYDADFFPVYLFPVYWFSVYWRDPVRPADPDRIGVAARCRHCLPDRRID